MTPTTSSSTYPRAAVLGGVAGLRMMLPLALLAFSESQRAGESNAGDALPWALLRARRTRVAIVLGTAVEVIGDKLPFSPSRLSPAPLGGRVVAGALAGSVLCRREGGSPVIGAAIGALAAGAGSLAGYYARVTLSKRTALPDLVGALTEDALALRLGTLAARSR